MQVVRDGPALSEDERSAIDAPFDGGTAEPRALALPVAIRLATLMGGQFELDQPEAERLTSTLTLPQPPGEEASEEADVEASAQA